MEKKETDDMADCCAKKVVMCAQNCSFYFCLCLCCPICRTCNDEECKKVNDYSNFDWSKSVGG